jgi:hypothetical protein
MPTSHLDRLPQGDAKVDRHETSGLTVASRQHGEGSDQVVLHSHAGHGFFIVHDETAWATRVNAFLG